MGEWVGEWVGERRECEGKWVSEWGEWVSEWGEWADEYWADES